MEWVDVITISLLPILLVKREKRNSLIIPLKYLEQNKIKRDVVKNDFARCSVIWKLICNTKINRGFPDLNSYISLPTNPPTIGSISFVIVWLARSRAQFRIKVIQGRKNVYDLTRNAYSPTGNSYGKIDASSWQKDFLLSCKMLFFSICVMKVNTLRTNSDTAYCQMQNYFSRQLTAKGHWWRYEFTTFSEAHIK